MKGHEVDRAGGGEVPGARRVRSLRDLDPLDRVDRYEVEVEVALAVRVSAQIHGNPVERDGEIGPVVRVEAPEEVLLRLAAARVLGGQDARNRLEELSGALERSKLEIARFHGEGRPLPSMQASP